MQTSAYSIHSAHTSQRNALGKRGGTQLHTRELYFQGALWERFLPAKSWGLMLVGTVDADWPPSGRAYSCLYWGIISTVVSATMPVAIDEFPFAI